MRVRKKFSILMMDDSGRVRRFRMRTRLFILGLALCFVIFPITAALGVWFAYEFWTESRELKLINHELEQKYTQAHAKAERLGNLEVLLRKLNPVDAEQIMHNLAGARAVKNSNALAGDDPEPQTEPSGQDDASSAIVGKAITVVNNGRISMEKVVAKVAPGHKVRISLDLLNPDQKKTIAGKINCTFLSAKGQNIPLVISPEMSDFKINRMKRVVIVSTLPENVGTTNASIIVEVAMEGDETVYRNAFPILR